MEKCDQCGAEGQGLTMQHGTNCPRQLRGVGEPPKRVVTNSAAPVSQTAPLRFSPYSGVPIVNIRMRDAKAFRQRNPAGSRWDYNPWTGDPRRIEDIESDPVGLLIVPPNEPIVSAAVPEKAWREPKYGKPMPDAIVDLKYVGIDDVQFGVPADTVDWYGVSHWRLSALPVVPNPARQQIAAETALEISKLRPGQAVIIDKGSVATETPVDYFVDMSIDDSRFPLNNYVEKMLDGDNGPGMQQSVEMLLVNKAGFAKDIAIRVATRIGMQDDETRLRGERGAGLLAAEATLQRLGYAWEGGELWKPPIGKAPAFSAPDLLDAASGHMRDRAAQYDKPKGERSMGNTVAAFNAITGRTLKESEGWLLLALLKMVRSETTEAPHRDSVEDLIAYAGLYGEARIGGK